MALETAGYVSALQPANPAAGDPVSQADDHIRLIKGTLTATFPNLNAAVSATPKNLSYDLVPVGGIIMWYGSAASIPSGWGLCNGATYTKVDGSGNITSPNLSDKFVVSAGSTYTQGTAGGAASVTPSITVGYYALTQNDLPLYNLTVNETAHSHTATDSGHAHGYSYASGPAGAAGGGPYLFGGPTSVAGTTASGTANITVATAKTNLTVSSAGGGAAHAHAAISSAISMLPPYYALCFIMKL